MPDYVIFESSRGVRLRRLGVAAGAVLLSLGMAACSKLGFGGGDQMSWARGALERNNRLEVVASDPQAGTFTVRIKDSGELRMIRVDEMVGGPPGWGISLATPSGTATPASSQPGSSQTTAAETAFTSPAGLSGNGLTSQGEPENPGAAPSTGPGQGSDPATAAKTAPRTGFESEPASAAGALNPNSDIASITPGGRTLESGPGYVIKAATKTTGATRTDRQRSLTTSAAVERRHDPIICQGDRLMQIDNRNFEFDGDAIAAEDGCEIHITNSHISAKGVGVSARAANVHIDNSQIEGDTASIDASNGAQVYASSSRFKGISRRLDNSSFHDLGGNIWN